MDEFSLLLDRAVASQVTSVVAPPVAEIRSRAHRRGVARAVASVAVVFVLAVSIIVGMATNGHASETGYRHLSASRTLPLSTLAAETRPSE